MKKIKKKTWLTVGSILMIPLLLYGALCFWFYLEKQKAPLLTYQFTYNSDRVPAEFKEVDGRKVYIKDGEEKNYPEYQGSDPKVGAWTDDFRKNVQEFVPSALNTGSEAEEICWNCYKGSWSEKFRESLAGWVPSDLKVDGGSRLANCGTGIVQAGIDIGAGIVLIAGGTVAYAAEFVNADNVNLYKHRASQAEYAMYFLMKGEIFKVISNSTKKLIKHIGTSIQKNDTYAICEMLTVFASLSFGPKLASKARGDKARLSRKETEIKEMNQGIKEQIKRLDNSIKDAQREYDTAYAMYKAGGAKKPSIDPTNGKPAGLGRVTQAELDAKRSRLAGLKQERRSFVQQNKTQSTFLAKTNRRMIQLAKSPLYFLQAVKEEVLSFVPRSAKKIIITPVVRSGVTAVKYTPYFAARNLKQEGERTLQDYLDSLEINEYPSP